MPQPRKQGSVKWYSKKYTEGYVENKRGIAQARHADESKSLRLAFKKEHEKIALAKLDEWLDLKLGNPLLYQQQKQEQRKKIQSPLIPVTSTVYGLIQEYYTAKIQHAGENVEKKFWQAVRFWFEQDLPLDYETIYQHVILQNNNHEYQPSYHYKLLQIARKVFDYAVKRQLLPRSPFELLDMPDVVTHEPETFSKEEMQKIFDWFKEPVPMAKNPKFRGLDEANRSRHPKRLYGLYFELLYHTAMRKTEGLNLTWDDIKENYIHIDGKGNYQREFPLKPFPEVQRILHELQEFKGLGDKIFPISEGKVQKWFVLAMENCDIPRERNGKRRTLHTVRASAEEVFEDDLQLPISIVTDLAGHNLNTYKKHYRTKKRASKLEKAIEMSKQK